MSRSAGSLWPAVSRPSEICFLIRLAMTSETRDVRPELGNMDPQNDSFTPSCSWRAGVDVVVIRPAVALRTPPASKIVALGSPRFTQLKALNASRRNWATMRPIFWFLKTDRSATLRPGARIEWRVGLPNTPGPGTEKTDGSNHWSAVPV